jgi:hypothetical protein
MMRTRTRKTAIATMAFLLALSALATVNPSVMADGDDEPGTGPWAEDGSIFRDSVRLSADDPDADPVDWYRVNLTAGPSQLDLLRINVNLTKNGGDQFLVWASIHDLDGALLQEVRSTSYAVKTTGFLCHQTGQYMVRVYTYSYLECHYRLEFQITQEANVTDGDDTLEQATFLEPPAEVTGHLHGIRDTFDHYAVNVSRDATHYEFIEVRIEPNGTSVGTMDLDLFLIAYDDQGVPRVVSSSLSNGSREVAWFAATVENVTIYIRCHAYGGDTGYKLNVTKFKVSDDGNNNIVRAEEIELGVPRNDSLNITDRLDFFKVNLTGGDLLSVFVQAHDYDPASRQPDLNIYLFSPTEVIINWSHSYDPLERVGWEVPLDDQPAVYFILVNFFDRSPGDGIPAYGEYDINVTVDHAPRILVDLPLVLEEEGYNETILFRFIEDDDTWYSSMDIKVLDEDNVSVEFNKRFEWGNIVDYINVSGHPNFTGMAWFTLEVTDSRRTVVLTVPVNVTPVPDAPAAVSPLPVIEMDEDGTLQIDLRDYIVDGDGDPLHFEPMFGDENPLAGSTQEGDLLTIIPDPDFSGEVTLSINATDPGELTTTVDLTVLVRPVQDPPVVLLDDASVTAQEDERGTEFDLSTLFSDPDGDALTYLIGPDDNVLFIVLESLLLVDPVEDFNGEVILSITAKDPTGAQAETTLTLTFTPVDDPPVLTSTSPDTSVELTEGEAATFTITARDPEQLTLSYTWFLDDVPISGEELPRFELVTNSSSQGAHLLTVRVTDGAQESWFNWTVLVENVNRSPELTLNRPKDGSSHEEGSNIVFEVLATDPDEEVLSVQWIEKDEVIGTGLAFTTSKLKPGKHTVTVRAIDPHGAATEANITFTVDEAGGLPGPSAVFAVAVISISAVVTASWRRRR